MKGTSRVVKPKSRMVKAKSRVVKLKSRVVMEFEGGEGKSRALKAKLRVE